MTSEQWEAHYLELKCLYDGNNGAEGGEISIREDQAEFLGLDLDPEEPGVGTAAGGLMVAIPEFLAAFEKLDRHPRSKAEGRAKNNPGPGLRQNPNQSPASIEASKRQADQDEADADTKKARTASRDTDDLDDRRTKAEDIDPKAGPTIEEFLDAGYFQEDYPPKGYDAKKSKLNPDAKAGKALPKITPEALTKARK